MEHDEKKLLHIIIGELWPKDHKKNQANNELVELNGDTSGYLYTYATLRSDVKSFVDFLCSDKILSLFPIEKLSSKDLAVLTLKHLNRGNHELHRIKAGYEGKTRISKSADYSIKDTLQSTRTVSDVPSIWGQFAESEWGISLPNEEEFNHIVSDAFTSDPDSCFKHKEIIGLENCLLLLKKLLFETYRVLDTLKIHTKEPVGVLYANTKDLFRLSDYCKNAIQAAQYNCLISNGDLSNKDRIQALCHFAEHMSEMKDDIIDQVITYNSQKVSVDSKIGPDSLINVVSKDEPHIDEVGGQGLSQALETVINGVRYYKELSDIIGLLYEEIKTSASNVFINAKDWMQCRSEKEYYLLGSSDYDFKAKLNTVKEIVDKACCDGHDWNHFSTRVLFREIYVSKVKYQRKTASTILRNYIENNEKPTTAQWLFLEEKLNRGEFWNTGLLDCYTLYRKNCISIGALYFLPLTVASYYEGYELTAGITNSLLEYLTSLLK